MLGTAAALIAGASRKKSRSITWYPKQRVARRIAPTLFRPVLAATCLKTTAMCGLGITLSRSTLPRGRSGSGAGWHLTDYLAFMLPPLAGFGFFAMACFLPLPALPMAMPLPALSLYMGLAVTA